MSRQHKRLDRRRWAFVRRKVLRRDGWRCQSCKKYGNNVDHIRPLFKGGAEYDESNLQTLCKPCHITKTRSEYGGAADPERVAWAALVRELSACE